MIVICPPRRTMFPPAFGSKRTPDPARGARAPQTVREPPPGRALRRAPRPGVAARGLRGGGARESRDDLPTVGRERLLLVACHQVEVELADTDGLELAQLRRARLRRADHG